MRWNRTVVRVVLTGALGCGMLVIATGPPAQAIGFDDFGDSQQILSEFARKYVISDLTAATVEPGEPFTAPLAAGYLTHTIWYAYNGPDGGPGTGVVDLCGSTSDAFAHVYVDTSGDFGGLELISTSSACANGGHRATFSFEPGQQVAIQIGIQAHQGDPVGALNGVFGTIHVWSVPPNDDRGDALPISSVVHGWNVNATPYHAPAPPPTEIGDTRFDDPPPAGDATVWYRWTAPSTERVGFALSGYEDDGCEVNTDYTDPFELTSAGLFVQRFDPDGTGQYPGHQVTVAGTGCPGEPGLKRVALTPIEGQTYQIAVANTPTGPVGEFGLHLQHAPELEDLPQIYGSGAPNSVLQAEDVWSDAETVSRTWLRCPGGPATCVALPGGPSLTYRVPACTNTSYSIRAKESAANWVGTASSPLSNAVLVPVHACSPPKVTGPKSLSGVHAVNKKSHRITLPRSWSVTCSWQPACTGHSTVRAKLKGAWVTLGSVAFPATSGKTPVLKVKVSAAALKKLRKVKTAHGKVVIRVVEPAGSHRSAAKVTKLKVSHGKA